MTTLLWWDLLTHVIKEENGGLQRGHTALECWDLGSDTALTVTPGLSLLQHRPPTDMGMSCSPIMSPSPAMKSRLIMGSLFCFVVIVVICGLVSPARVIWWNMQLA